MTQQCEEELIYDGQRYTLRETPLEAWFEMVGRRLPPRPDGTHCQNSSLWRGYIGTWEITGNRLYLVRLDGSYVQWPELCLACIFPEHPDRVFAHWFSGTLTVPQGEVIEYLPMIGERRERELMIRIERGVVSDTQVRRNQPILDASPQIECGG